MRRQKEMTFRGPGIFLLAVAIFALGFALGFLSFRKSASPARPAPPASETADPYLSFLAETYSLIQKNFWKSLTDADLSSLYHLAATNLTHKEVPVTPANFEGLKNLWLALTKDFTPEQKKELAVKLVGTVIGSLPPSGRSNLYTQKDEVSLANRVQNINPQRNLYDDLGVGRGATETEVKKAYDQEVARLTPLKESSPAAKKKLEEIAYAYGVLKNQKTKVVYDQKGAEPTVFAKLLGPAVSYLKIQQISPETFTEFQNEIGSLSPKSGPEALVLDLRGNVGGSIDILPYFLGPFLGVGHYGYEFFHQGETTPYKTQTEALASLSRFKKVVILVDAATQSSAEVIAASLKRYKFGVLFGQKTHGWGTIEKVFPLTTQIDPHEHYSLFLVHSLTLRDDGQPIEGAGVEPAVNIENKDWPQELLGYFNFPPLVAAVRDLYKTSGKN